MSYSRTATGAWKAIVKQARALAIEAGLTRCPICGVSLDWDHAKRPNSAEVDHIIPHARGGPDTLENTRVICRYDNQRLGGRMNKRKPRAVIETVELDVTDIW